MAWLIIIGLIDGPAYNLSADGKKPIGNSSPLI